MSGGPVEVRVQKSFHVSAEQVFDAWTTPEFLGRWMFGAAVREEEIVHLRLDLRVGEPFSFLVRRGGVEVDHIGQYLEIDRPRRLAFTWAVAGHSDDEPSRVTIDIASREGGSKLTLVHAMPARWADFASRTEAGWTKMLAALSGALGEA